MENKIELTLKEFQAMLAKIARLEQQKTAGRVRESELISELDAVKYELALHAREKVA